MNGVTKIGDCIQTCAPTLVRYRDFVLNVTSGET